MHPLATNPRRQQRKEDLNLLEGSIEFMERSPHPLNVLNMRDVYVTADTSPGPPEAGTSTTVPRNIFVYSAAIPRKPKWSDDLVDYRDLTQTGYFRDQKRRIDMVLVIENTKNPKIEHIKSTFLRNCTLSGLDLEFETGVQSQHQHLVFVKVHAPDAVLHSAAKLFGTRKYFRDHHLKFMKDAVTDEKELIRAVRSNYPGPDWFSTMDRSCLVFRLLRHIPFGKPANYAGIGRLMIQNIIVDAYPLHDGPYFTVPKQNLNVLNGRQVLFDRWVGYENFFEYQPVNLIREYLGERVGFLFAFFQFYNFALLVISLVGIAVFVAGWTSSEYDEINFRYAMMLGKTMRFLTIPDTLKSVKAFRSYIIINESICTKSNETRYSFPASSYTFTKQVIRSYTYIILKFFNEDKVYDHEPIQNMLAECKTWTDKSCPYNDSMWTYYGYKTVMVFGIARKVFSYAIEYTAMKTFTLLGVGNKSEGEIAYDGFLICPKCSNFQYCPFINMSTYCPEVKFKNFIDNPYWLPFAAFIAVWSLLFVRLWRRKETYLYWLWEVREDECKNIYRYDYQTEGLYRFCRGVIMRFSIASISICVYAFGMIPIMLILQRKVTQELLFLYETHRLDVILGNYIKLIVVSVIKSYLVIGLQKAYRKISYVLTRRCGNFETEEEYEFSLACNMFGFRTMVNLGMPGFYAFAKGLAYTYPSDHSRWLLPPQVLQLGTGNCGLLSCIDELFIVFVVNFFCEKVFEDLSVRFGPERHTDYSRGLRYNQLVPCWEKEFELASFNETHVMNKYNYIIVQFAVLSALIPICPLAGIVVFIMNLYEIRHWAYELTMTHRRPRLGKTWGLGQWRFLLQAIPFCASIWNVMTIVRQSSVLQRMVHKENFPGTRFFLDFAMSFFDTSDYTLASSNTTGPHREWDRYRHAYLYSYMYPFWQRADFCMFPGMYNRRVAPSKDKAKAKVLPNSYTPNINHWYLVRQNMLLIFFFETFTILAALIIYHAINAPCAKVANTIEVENIMKEQTIKREKLKKEE